MMTHLTQIANRFYEAEKNRKPTFPIEEAISIDEAYQIQQINVARFLKDGKRVIGFKIGLTSEAVQKEFKIAHPDFGHLYHDSWIGDGSVIDSKTLIQPKIEAEIAFVLKKSLAGPGITLVDVMNSVDYVLPALEIVDSRVEAWKIRAIDTIADNGSSALFVLGGVPHSLHSLNLPFTGMALSQNGEVMVTGAGGAVMGNPLNAVVFLANELGKRGHELKEENVVLSGAISSMLSMKSGDFFHCDFEKMGRISVGYQ